MADDSIGDSAQVLQLVQKDKLFAGRTARLKSTSITVRDHCNSFQTVKKTMAKGTGGIAAEDVLLSDCEFPQLNQAIASA